MGTRNLRKIFSFTSYVSWGKQQIGVCMKDLECVWNVMAHAETRFGLSAKRTSPFKSSGASVQSTAGSRGVRISGSNAGYIKFRGSVKRCEGDWLPTPFASYPFTSPPVRHRVPSGFNLTLLNFLFDCDNSRIYRGWHMKQFGDRIWTAVHQSIIQTCRRCEIMRFCKINWKQNCHLTLDTFLKYNMYFEPHKIYQNIRSLFRYLKTKSSCFVCWRFSVEIPARWPDIQAGFCSLMFLWLCLIV